VNLDVCEHSAGASEVGVGDPVLLVHGIGEDHRGWRRVLPLLMLERRVILYDLRGHGASSLGNGVGTLSQFGDDLAGLLDALGIDRLPIVGFSMGGLIGAQAAIDHPDRVSALATISTSPVVGAGAAAWYEERARLGSDGDESLRGVLEKDTDALFRHEQDLVEGRRIRSDATRDLAGFGNACAALAALAAAPLAPQLSRIEAPTLVVVGADDHHTDPSMADTLVSSIPDATLQAVPGAAYAVPVEQGPELARVLIAWFAKLGV
jgi:pimeloyl-ACP methyl ester carboxylesterase